MKEEESSTLEIVQSIQNITVTLQKSKEICLQRKQEYEKTKKDNASQKELEKSEIKFRKAQDDYKLLVDKYTVIRNDFETKMTQACRVSLALFSRVSVWVFFDRIVYNGVLCVVCF